METKRYRVVGGPGSPYSLKLRAAMRYRRLPHIWVVPQSYIGGDSELERAGKKMIPNLQLPEDGTYWADSTPIIYELEKRHPGDRSLIPLDPADAFLAHLIEDFADELMFPMIMSYRWSQPLDLQFCPRRQLTGWLGFMPTAQFEQMVNVFRQRQTQYVANIGPVAVNMPLYEHVYMSILKILESLLTQSRYFFGSRPSIAEMGLFGQLSQIAVDSTGSAIMKERAPRAFQWIQDLDDASGVEGEWRTHEAPVPDALRNLLQLIADVYLPFLTANARAIKEDRSEFSVDCAGLRFEGSSKPYRANCLLWLKDEYAKLPAQARKQVDILMGTEAVQMLKFSDGEAAVVPPQVPL